MIQNVFQNEVGSHIFTPAVWEGEFRLLDFALKIFRTAQQIMINEEKKHGEGDPDPFFSDSSRKKMWKDLSTQPYLRSSSMQLRSLSQLAFDRLSHAKEFARASDHDSERKDWLYSR
uniref:Uncharacterized protein n=1 Tax=Solanum lycopersicum TaxID=4081 RepID=A0A3Q7GWF3_SOLLC